MKRYGNIRFTRRVVVTLCLLVVAVSVLMPAQVVRADTGSTHVIKYYSNWNNKPAYDRDLLSISGNYSFVWVRHSYDGKVYNTGLIVCSPGSVRKLSNMFESNVSADSSVCDIRYNTFNCNYSEYLIGNSDAGCSMLLYENNKKIVPTSYYEFVNMSQRDVFDKVTEMYKKGELADNVNSPTKVTNESIGYLQDVKLNLSYVTPIKGDSIFETTNYQIYSDMIYNLKWNGKQTTTNFDLSSSYVQLYAKAEYKSDRNNNTASDFFALSDSKAPLGKYKVSFMELFEKSSKCKSAYLSDYPLSSADYKNGKLQACSVTSNIKYKFYIRVYKGTDKGPWLCVSEKGSHHSNEFVNSGVKVPFNVSSGGLDSDGTYKPDGNINENGNGITGTGSDKDDADADTNANDKIQSKHDSSNTTFDKLEEFVQGIGDVPKMIADIFSFLPSWCLDVVGIGFSLLMILIVVKFIRG